MLSEKSKKKRKAEFVDELKLFEEEDISIHTPKNVLGKIKKDFSKLKKENSGQGAAEYILLFGGVIVIALAGLLIYRSYFSNNASGLNATQDISSIRSNMTNIPW